MSSTAQLLKKQLQALVASNTAISEHGPLNDYATRTAHLEHGRIRSTNLRLWVGTATIHHMMEIVDLELVPIGFKGTNENKQAAVAPLSPIPLHRHLFPRSHLSPFAGLQPDDDEGVNLVCRKINSID